MKLKSITLSICVSMLSLAFVSISHVEAQTKPPKATKTNTKAGKAKAPAQLSRAVIAKQEADAARTMATRNASQMVSCETVAAKVDSWVSADALSAYIASRGAGELSDQNLAKGEFETSLEYNTRVRAILAKYVGDPDRVIFRIPIDDEMQDFDADKQLLSISIDASKPLSGGTYPYNELLISERETKVKTNTLGRTALGVTFRYDSYVRSETHLELLEGDLTSLIMKLGKSNIDSYMGRGERIRLQADSRLARELAESLELVVFGNLDAPYYTRSEDFEIARLDTEYEQFTVSRLWFVKPRCAFLYDNKNNKILFTFSPKAVSEIDTPLKEGTLDLANGSAIDCKSNYIPPKKVIEFDVNRAWPQRAKEKGAEGKVIATLQIDSRGEVVGVIVKSASPAGYFESAVEREARKMLFEPALQCGVPISSDFELVVTFSINK